MSEPHSKSNEPSLSWSYSASHSSAPVVCFKQRARASRFLNRSMWSMRLLVAHWPQRAAQAPALYQCWLGKGN